MGKDECVSCRCLETMVDLLATANQAVDAVECEAYNIKSSMEQREQMGQIPPQPPESLEAARPANRVKKLIDAMTKAENECGFERTASRGGLRGMNMILAAEYMQESLDHGPGNVTDAWVLNFIRDNIWASVKACELNKYKCEL